MAQRLRHLVAVALMATIALACGGSSDRQATATPPPAAGSQPSTASPSPVAAEAAAKPADPAQAAGEPAPDDAAIESMLKPWTGDLDGMVERRYIRMLVTFSKTNYFLDGPTQRGATYDGAKLFEKFLNDRLKSKTIQVHIKNLLLKLKVNDRTAAVNVALKRGIIHL